jgi:aflatoxin B1 aldehyde reductase
MVEAELLPLLKEHGCSFVAYNPLAAGLLSGKHAAGGEVPAGRFKDNENYLPRFYTQANFEALEKIRAACEASGITMVEASFAWLLQHSKLGPEDGLLIGASSLEQLDANLAACTEGRGPLAAAVLAAFNDAWDVTKDGAFAYWRSYSSDMPGREQLDQGAAYKAHGPPAK